MNVYISGTSRGIGKALAEHYCIENNVFGISRSGQTDKFNHVQCDLTDYERLNIKVTEQLKEIDELDLVFLNAGVLGKIQTLKEADMSDMKFTMEVNLWSQKVLLDLLLTKKVKTVIAISSGAAVNGSKGWSAYSLSKAALNMLIKLYADEFKETKFIALAPGLVDTAMQDTICSEDTTKFPNLQRLQDARGTDSMPNPEGFVEKFKSLERKILSRDSGEFIDIRKI